MRIIIAISGASGAIYGIRLLEMLQNKEDIETHLVISKAAQLTILQETKHSVESVRKLATHSYHASDIAAKIASGSFLTEGMIIAPCSMKTTASIACGLEDNLIARAAGVTLKERRRLVLMVRETPLFSTHLENMLKLSNYGAIIAPPVPAFYNLPSTIEDIVNHSVARVLDLFSIETTKVKRWSGLKGEMLLNKF